MQELGTQYHNKLKTYFHKFLMFSSYTPNSKIKEEISYSIVNIMQSKLAPKITINFKINEINEN